MRFTALSVAAAMMLAVAPGCRDDAEPPVEEETADPAPKRPPKRREPAPKRRKPQKRLRPRKKSSPPTAEAPAAPDKKSGGGKAKGKDQGGRTDGKAKGKDQGGQGDSGNGGNGVNDSQGGQGGSGQGGQGGQGGSGNGGQGGQGGSGQGGQGGSGQGGQGGQGGSGNGGQGRRGGKGGSRLPKGWEDNEVSVPPADSEKQLWDLMVGELVKLAAGPAEFAPLGSPQTSLKRNKSRYHATGRCTFTDDSGARSGYTFSCDFAGNGYEVTILRVDFRPAGD